MDTTTAEPMTELLLDLPAEAVERLEELAAQQGCTVDEMAQSLLSRGLEKLIAEQEEPPAGGCPLPVS